MEQKQRVRHREEAVELIECYLQTNEIPPHGKLPAEREMCEMWGLNRTTLRAAIRRLTEMGSLFFLTGIARDYNNVPVEFFKSVARPDMVRFSSILRKHRTEPERRQPL